MKNKVKTFPKLPGIYTFKDKDNNILYLGKAKSLKNRVASYFANQHKDWKIKQLIDESVDIDYIITQNEEEALLLEAQLIREKKPKFNVLLKHGQPFVYFMFTYDDIPVFKTTRNRKERGEYFGPFVKKQEARKVFEFLTRKFKLKTCNQKIPTGCLNYHIGNCAGMCMGTKFDTTEHLLKIKIVKELLAQNYDNLRTTLEDEFKIAMQELKFERARNLHEYLQNLEGVITYLKIYYTETKYENEVSFMSSDICNVVETPNLINRKLQEFLNLDSQPITIDCFDISHFQSQYIVGSCVRFKNGIPEKNKFRRFKIKTLDTQNDYAALQEIVTRRYRDPNEIPDIIMIDGGKGQLNAVKNLFPKSVFVSLAKREEILFTPNNPDGIHLDIQTEVGRLLISIRDYAHHFAINYHRLRRSKNHLI
ncbi:MAG: GIY-YIG nuclease family protein [Candidatus Babeliales bacterium]|nr:GIY-YIG nuclease family protein [Candidatus Babeliales bacterium]